jgi:glycosyltransferase involved in cell wall biosynthesis
VLTVSIILPTHDRPERLRRAVGSILAQTRRPDELIVIDDGGGGEPTALAGKVRDAGVRFVHERRERPSLPASRNRGMAIARGDVLLFMDDDVTLPPSFVSDLMALYEADAGGVVAGIGATVSPPKARRRAQRLWDALCYRLGQTRWVPRRCAARHVRLPPPLRGPLAAARRLYGCAMSFRAAVGRAHRFDEALAGYALGEDMDYSFRVGKTRALFLAAGLRVAHEPGGGGRPDGRALGRMYVVNHLRIAARGSDGDAGTWAVLACDFLAVIVMSVAWSALSLRRRNLAFAAGMVAALAGRAAATVGQWLSPRQEAATRAT